MAILRLVLMLAFSNRFRHSKARMERYSWVSARCAKIPITCARDKMMMGMMMLKKRKKKFKKKKEGVYKYILRGNAESCDKMSREGFLTGGTLSKLGI